MRISPVNYKFSTPKTQNRLAPKNNSQNIPFRGNSYDSMIFFLGPDLCPIEPSPGLILKGLLIREGCTPEEISEWGVFTNQQLQNGLGYNLETDLFGNYTEELITPDDATEVYMETPKDREDINATLRVFQALKEKFYTYDVDSYLDKQIKNYNCVSQLLGLGQNTQVQSKKQGYKDYILEILSYTNKNNAVIVEALLDDENFDNTEIPNSILEPASEENVQIGLKVLDYAQSVGYQKAFSFALAVMISEANKDNMHAILKAVHEQDFLIENYEFVSQKLVEFLNRDDDLVEQYACTDMTLEDVNQIMEAEEDEDFD